MRSTFSNATYQQLKAANQTMTDLIAGTSLESFNFASNGSSEIATAFGVSGNYFKVLGVSAVVGRTIEESDEQPGAEPVAVISHGFWQRRFGGDASIVGKTVRLNTTQVTIVGVLPPSFIGIQRMADTSRAMCSCPLRSNRSWSSPRRRGLGRAGRSRASTSRPTGTLQIAGRLKPGATIEQVKGNLAGPFEQAARAGMDSYIAGLTDDQRKLSRNQREGTAVPELLVLPGARGIYDLDRTSSRSASVLSAVVVLLLLIVCANVANLLLSRSAARYREVSVRLSMGASRRRLVRQLLTESLLLSGTGGALGIALGYWSKKLLPFGQNTAIDWQVLAFVAGISMLTGLTFGLIPALRATQVDLASAMKENSRSVAASRTWLSKALLVTQVAVSVMLLIGAGLFVRTLQNLRSVDIGFNAANILMFRVNPALNGYSPERISAALSAHAVDARSAAGRAICFVHPQRAAVRQHQHHGNLPPGPDRQEGDGHLLHGGGAEVFRHAADPDLPDAISTNATSPIPKPRQSSTRRQPGNISPTRTRSASASARTSKRAARPRSSASSATPSTTASATPRRRRCIRRFGPGTRSLTVMVRTAGEPASLTETVRNGDAAGRSRRADDRRDDAERAGRAARFAQERLFALAYSLFGALALLLACIGLFGLMSYSVSRRTNEIGIRMALGAERAGVVGMVLRESMLMVAIGVVIGVAGAIGGGRFVESVLFGLSATDVWTISAAIGATVLVSLAAGYLPARRASRVDPMVALTIRIGRVQRAYCA